MAGVEKSVSSVATPTVAATGARPSPKQNQLLAALTAESYNRLLPELELVPMPLGWAIYESGDRLRYAYFPTTSIVSLLYIMEDGASAEMAITGNEGLIGISLFMSGGITSNRAVVQNAGYGYRLKASTVKSEFALSGIFQQLSLRYTQALITQTAQTAVCNRHHMLEQQLCRLLLLNLDRLEGNELLLTQELIAHNLGVRRESVTEAACKLQTDGLIRYHRGHITVLNRPSLENRVCECYTAVKNEFKRLLPQPQRLAA
ncbi:MAG: Crp/Fnr family transcriptional regulator [Candidatus Parcubacteria bacterium]|nr:Crp/Fnr family transcriptional regulator [Burkholderiales bacterium]